MTDVVVSTIDVDGDSDEVTTVELSAMLVDDDPDEHAETARRIATMDHELRFMMRVIVVERTHARRHMNGGSTCEQTVTVSPCQAKDRGLF